LILSIAENTNRFYPKKQKGQGNHGDCKVVERTFPFPFWSNSIYTKFSGVGGNGNIPLDNLSSHRLQMTQIDADILSYQAKLSAKIGVICG